jgi:NADPH:quinone reductase-like Zn-dependent oxidoreductase
MKIITQRSFGGPQVLEVTEAPPPAVGPGDVLVAVAAVGVNPVDANVRAGYFPILGEPPFTVGWDVAGVVRALGAGVEGLEVGDRVLGMPRFPEPAATYAELVVAPAAHLARVPGRLDDQAAAALPLVGLTAWQALVQIADVGPGTRVLVQAAGGGVGHVAVQIAKARGAYVVATASTGKVDFVRSLGADEVVDYTTTPLSSIEQADVVLDPFGGDRLPQAVDLARSGGQVTVLLGEIGPRAQALADERSVRIARVGVVPDAEALAGLLDLVERGELTPHVQAAFPLERAADAHDELARGVRGKLVLVP